MKTISAKSDSEIAAFIKEQRELVQKSRFGMGGSDVKAVKAAKKNIARALTELTIRAHKVNK